MAHIHANQLFRILNVLFDIFVFYHFLSPFPTLTQTKERINELTIYLADIIDSFGSRHLRMIGELSHLIRCHRVTDLPLPPTGRTDSLRTRPSVTNRFMIVSSLALDLSGLPIGKGRCALGTPASPFRMNRTASRAS